MKEKSLINIAILSAGIGLGLFMSYGMDKFKQIKVPQSSQELVQTADSSVVKRRALIEEMLKRDEHINNGCFSSYQVKLGTNTFDVIPLSGRKGFKFYRGVLDDEKKVLVKIGLDSSVEAKAWSWTSSGPYDFSSDPLIRENALRTGDGLVRDVLRQQEKTLYDGHLAYQRLKAFVTPSVDDKKD